MFPDKPGQVQAGQWLIEHLHGDRVVLDVDCGTGVPTAGQLADAGCTVVGVDSSPAMLETARKNVPQGIFVQRELHDLTGLHPREGRFDGAVAFFSLPGHDRHDIGHALDAIHNVLAAEAVCVVGVDGAVMPTRELADLLRHNGFTVESMTDEQTYLYARCFVTPAM